MRTYKDKVIKERQHIEEQQDILIETLRGEYDSHIERMKNLDTKIRILLVVATAFSGIFFSLFERIFDEKLQSTIFTFSVDDTDYTQRIIVYSVIVISVGLTTQFSLFYFILKSMFLRESARLGNLIKLYNSSRDKKDFQIKLIRAYNTATRMIILGVKQRIYYIEAEKRLFVLFSLIVILAMVFSSEFFYQHLMRSLK